MNDKDNTMKTVDGIFDGKRVYLLEKVKGNKKSRVTVSFGDELTEEEIAGLFPAYAQSDAFGFWHNSEEDIYQDMVSFREALYSSKFPSPPGRDLFFITHGRPQQQEVLDFFAWVLAEGQKFVEPAGYVSLDAGILKNQLKKISEEVRYE